MEENTPLREHELGEDEHYTDKKKIHLLSLKRRTIPYHHTEVREYMGEVEWESEEEE